MTLTLCNPNKKEGESDEVPAAVTATESKVEAKKPEPPPEPEAPKDPATDSVGANKDTVIEINCEKKPLGVVVVKGDSSAVQVSVKSRLVMCRFCSDSHFAVRSVCDRDP